MWESTDSNSRRPGFHFLRCSHRAARWAGPRKHYRLTAKAAGTTGEHLQMRMSNESNPTSFVSGNTIPGGQSATVLATLLLAAVAVCSAQTERPALVPSQQGGSSAGAAALQSSQLGSIGGLTDEPISPGETVHIIVFDAPDFSLVTRVSESGDVAYPLVGAVHIAGLNSAAAEALIAGQLKERDLMPNPQVLVTVDSASTGITVLGEVRSPGIYPPPGKHLLSDLLAAAGGLNASAGRVIEITSDHAPDKTIDIPWDPTMHNTSNYDRVVFPGDRVLVRGCGIAYVGGKVLKPGAYSLCGSPQLTLSEMIAIAGGIAPMASQSKTFLVRAQPDGTKVVQQIDVHKVLSSKSADPVVREDDIIYVSPSPLKVAASQAMLFAFGITNALIYAYHP